MITTLIDVILSHDWYVWQPKVMNILQFYWDDSALDDLSGRLKLLLDEIQHTSADYQHHILIGHTAFHCFTGDRLEMTKHFVSLDEDELLNEFINIPEWNAIRLWGWEEGDGVSFDALSHLNVVSLAQCEGPRFAGDMDNLSILLGARIPESHKASEKTAATFLAIVLDHRSGRISLFGEADKDFTLKWGHLFSKISAYKALREIRQRMLLEAK